jgi:hypothetical protein
MSLKATKIGGTSVLTILGVVCLASFMIAAFTWSSQSTTSKDPQEVVLGTPTVDQWSTTDFFEASNPYEISMPVTYYHHGQASISYYIKVTATAVGTMEMGDFTVVLTGIDGASLTETGTGIWTSGTLTIPSSTTSGSITITVNPTTNALDLSDVSFDVSAQSIAD